MAKKMKVTIFVEPGRIALDEKPIPEVGPLDALVRVTTTTICGTDVHIMKGEYPVAKGLTIGHEPVGVIEKLGSAVVGYTEGQRVVAGAITPSGWSNACLCGFCSQDGAGTKHGWKAMGGWKFGNTIDGCQAEFVLVHDAMANLAPVPDGLTDEQVLMCPDIMSTGFSGAERGKVGIGDAVAVFAQGPIGLCATVGAKLSGATTIIAVDRVAARMAISLNLGANHVIDFSKVDPVDEIMRITEKRPRHGRNEMRQMSRFYPRARRNIPHHASGASMMTLTMPGKYPYGSFASNGNTKWASSVIPSTQKMSTPDSNRHCSRA